jgi:DNA primase
MEHSYLIEQIKAVDLVDFFKDMGFKVEKRKLCCPFHDDKTPSMIIYPENWYHCFGCGKHGDIFNFYQQYYDLGFRDALFQLAGRYVPSFSGFSPRESAPKSNYKKELKVVSVPKIDDVKNTGSHFSYIYEAFRTFCVSQPTNELATKAFDYLQGRGFDLKTIKDFKIFVVKSYADANSYLRNHFDLQDLKDSGLMNERGNLIFFKHPVVIPYIQDNQIVFLQGRQLGQAEEGISKYQFLGGIQRPIFNQDVLKTLKLNQKVYVTEGAFDCMSLSQKGYPAISFGSAKTFKKEWARLFRRYEMVIFFDNDPSGVQGGLDILELLTLAGINAYRKYLPSSYNDINEYFQQNDSL